MEHRNYAIVPVFSAIILIPQVLFWWFVPADASARLIVYLFGTALTAGIPTVYLGTYIKSSLRMTAGLFIVSGSLYVASIAVSALLLSKNCSMRTAVYSYVIAILVYIIILAPMLNSIMNSHRIGINSVDDVDGCGDTLTQETERDTSSAVSIERIEPFAGNDMKINPGTKPMPPRNR